MNKELQTVFHYHETTKHSQKRYAKSLGYMDWATQPDPFRIYKGAKSLTLPLSFDNPTPPYSLLDEELPSAPLMLESLSQLLQFSMGIAAWKSSGGSSWAVRCNASSGNLHPTESYLILPPMMGGAKSSVSHYAPKNHALEILAEFDTNFFETLPNESFLIALSSIAWREAWKYGERAFRYVQLDAGHAWQALVVSAKMLGWKITRIDNVSDKQIAKIIGLDQENRFFEDEKPDMLLIVSKEESSPNLDVTPLIDALPNKYEGIANKLSPSIYEWKLIDEVEKATSVMQISQAQRDRCKVAREPSRESKEVVLSRRSVHVMDKEKSKISKKQFHALLRSVDCSLDGKENAAHLAIFVHRVEEYDQGLYLHVRNQKDLEDFKKEFHDAFLWRKTDFENLYLLEIADFTKASKIISCNQDIASDGAFSLGMICRYSEELLAYNAHRYKELYWECGMTGQQLYLEATALGLSGTGIGCFLDDLMNVNVLGLKNNLYQSLYHFTVGVGYVDSRIETKPAY
ncbi:SagB/ThcOx family dehydrogenase [Sulfurimonas sediminis]|uniref:SagB/ThcOx family dehydrogenase n=1 Tax=Sulfurimonas sediminis TaxID=2590020 RepID=A0A7M1B264_9BACT|nr:SagB family peptide dehydrogenase [Sulfurimonas sediminis]QOP42752.1 SagB/ThcOx family dehydrogenase [Sulfurimonas sediminis]